MKYFFILIACLACGGVLFYQLSLTNDDNLDIQHDVNDSVVKEEVKKVEQKQEKREDQYGKIE